MKILALQSWKGDYHILRPEIELFKGLKNKGVDVHLIGQHTTPIVQEFLQYGFTVYDFSFERKFDRENTNKLKQIIDNEKFDLIHAIHNKSVANVIRAVKDTKIPLVAYRGASINWTDPTNYITFLNPRVDTLICLSKAVEQNVQRNLKFWKTPTVQIYKGQNINWFSDIKSVEKEDFSLPKNAFIVSLASSVRRVKGVEYLLKATHHIPSDLPIYFLLAGTGTDKESLQKLKNQSPIANNIRLLGHRKDVLSIIKSSDCFVLPTIGIEGLSRSVMEAMMLKTPVISTKCGGPEELITHHKTGLLIDKKDPKAIAEAVLQLYQDAEQRQQLAISAQQNIIENFSIEQSIDKTYQLYKELVK